MTKPTSSQNSSLSQILERSRLLASQVNPQELAPLERGLSQIATQSQTLKANSAPSGNGLDIKAHYFLAQAGVNTQVLTRELGTIYLGEPTEYRQPIKDTDVEGYFKQKRTQTIVDLMESEKQEILQDMDNEFDSEIRETWDDIRVRLCGTEGQDGTDTIDSASATMLKSRLNVLQTNRFQMD
ncbi:hypothetical protein F4703DRAFT_1848331 [Phycomyces blakesleeanus]